MPRDTVDAIAGAVWEGRGQVDPLSVRLDELPDLPPFGTTTPAEWDELNELVETMLDPRAGARGPRARRTLAEKHRKALPVLVNRLRTLDFSTAEGNENGDQIQRLLRDICGGKHYGWRYSTANEDVVHCRKAVRVWHGMIADWALGTDADWAALLGVEVADIPDPDARSE